MAADTTTRVRRVRVVGRAWRRGDRGHVQVKATVRLTPRPGSPELWDVAIWDAGRWSDPIGQLARTHPRTRQTPLWLCSADGHATGGWTARRNDALCELLGALGRGTVETGVTP